jgi:hypothetical protein
MLLNGTRVSKAFGMRVCRMAERAAASALDEGSPDSSNRPRWAASIACQTCVSQSSWLAAAGMASEHACAAATTCDAWIARSKSHRLPCSWEALGRAEAQRAALQQAADAAEAGVLAATDQLATCQAALAEQRKVGHNNAAD